MSANCLLIASALAEPEAALEDATFARSLARRLPSVRPHGPRRRDSCTGYSTRSSEARISQFSTQCKGFSRDPTSKTPNSTPPVRRGALPDTRLDREFLL